MATPPLTVAVLRGGTVESRHHVHAVAVQGGRVVESAGDPQFVTFMRSAAKPLQAVPLARARADLASTELAIASASHLARPEQLSAVSSLLVAAEATEDDLECGLAGHPPRRLKHNCSGKHAGMLLLARTQGWDGRDYRLPDHPVQRAMLNEISAAAAMPADQVPIGVDGCGVVTFALPLDRIAAVFAALSESEAGERVAAAMREHPELVRGPGAPDTDLMRALGDWTAKVGAEGLFCAAAPEGLGIALKVEDGASRAVGPAAAAFLGRLGHAFPQADATQVENSRGEIVGEVRTAP
ncbi:MAG: asparaginase [Gaiellaceae bacterium]